MRACVCLCFVGGRINHRLNLKPQYHSLVPRGEPWLGVVVHSSAGKKITWYICILICSNCNYTVNLKTVGAYSLVLRTRNAWGSKCFQGPNSHFSVSFYLLSIKVVANKDFRYTQKSI